MIRLRFIILLTLFLAAASAISSRAANEPYQRAAGEVGPFQSYFPITTYVPSPTNCRYGINLSYSRGGQWVPALGVGHYINFAAKPNGYPVPETAELLFQVRFEQLKNDDAYLPVVEVRPPLTMEAGGLGPLVLANPGRLWLVGNEPDVAHDNQDNMLPTTYAWVYRSVYNFIKDIDPTAQVANAGLSMMTPGRRQYLNIVWNTYLQEFGEEMPVDVWNMHLYILSEIRPWDGGNADGKVALGTNPALAIKAPYGPPLEECPKDDVYCRAEHDSMDIFRDQIVRMRQWMKNHGQEDKPLILSEYSQLYPFVGYDDPLNPSTCYIKDEFGQCFTPNRVSSYMQQTMAYLQSAKDLDLGYPADDYRLVQQWAWFSMWTEQNTSGSSSNLLVDNYHDYSIGALEAFTQVGHTYRDIILSEPLTVNLVAADAADVTVAASSPDGTADVNLSLGFYNNGSTYIAQPFVVVFFADEALHEVIGGVQVSPSRTKPINGCSWGRITDWASVTWRDVPVGTHTYWAKVDGPNDIHRETSERDNVITGQVTVTP